MDKEKEALDIVLDIPNNISLNPFDRPPNIMDDELNSVTQEELEANLSTDCPTVGTVETMETTTHQNANDMWEQLIQSVLEDTSTQDAVEAAEEDEQKIEYQSEQIKVTLEENMEMGSDEDESSNLELEEDGREQINNPENDREQLSNPENDVEQLSNPEIDRDQLSNPEIDRDKFSNPSNDGVQLNNQEDDSESLNDQEEDRAPSTNQEDDKEPENDVQLNSPQDIREHNTEKDHEQFHESNSTDNNSNFNAVLIKDEETVMDYSLEEEQMLSQHITDNYYIDDVNNDDAQDDLCQVEVYASHQEDVVTEQMQFKDEIPDRYEEFLEDNLSVESAIRIGRLENIECKEEDNDEDNDKEPDKAKESQLSIIISDHCYSQEVSNKFGESDILKYNLINHLMTQKLNKEDYQKVTKLVDRILNDFDDEKLNKMLDYLDISETNNMPIAIPEEINPTTTENQDILPDIQNEISVDQENIEEKLGILEDIQESFGQEISNIEDPQENLEIPADTTEINETVTQEPTALETLVNAIPQQEVTEDLNENQSHDISLKENPQIILTNEEPQQMETENVSVQEMETNETEESANTQSNEYANNSANPSVVNDNDNFQTPLNTESESADPKTIIESLADNCSEPIEHNLFEEEFESLCKNGILSTAKEEIKTDLSLQLLDKLKDFVTDIQKDCLAFATASTNIEEKLHDYIKQQFLQYQDLFKPYCHSNNKQTIETQTDFKKLIRRKRKSVKREKKQNLSKTSDHSTIYSSTSSSSSSSSSSDDEDATLHKRENANKTPLPDLSQPQQQEIGEETETLPSEIKSLSLLPPPPPPPCSTNHLINNYSQEYDDGINLSQYVQSEIFNIDSTSQQSLIPSDDSDSAKDDDVSDIVPILNRQNSYDDEDKDSDDDIIFKIRPKKAKKITDSSSESNKTSSRRKSQDDNMSVNSESDKENLTSDRKDKKSNDSMDEDEKNDKEIERLTNISGLAKRPIANASSTKGSDKSKPKVATSKNLNDRFDFMDVEFGSDDEVKSDAEEEVITEKQFLERCNEESKRQMLDESSTDSDALDEDDDDLLKASSEEDNDGGNKSPLVEKFLKTFVVDDSDNDIDDDDDNVDLDSDKDEEMSASKEDQKADDVTALDDKDKNAAADNGEDDEDSPSAAELELLDANFRYRNRSTKNHKLEKMLSDVEKRKNISKIDAELISLSSDTENSDIEAIDDVEPNQSTKPRALKPMLRNDQLAGETIIAQKTENERISRLEKKHNMLEKVLKQHPDLDKNKELILDYIKDSKTFVKVHPGIVKHLKPHQFDGVRFMYDSCYGGVDSLKKHPGSGCILAHCMGLGKTLQLIALLHTVITYKELKTTKILVLCPKSTVMNWADEIIRWLGPLRQKNVKVYTFSDTSDINDKLSILKEWSLSSNTRAGCLLIGYEAFRTLVFYHSYKNRGNIDAQRLEEIRKNIDSCLLQPGADLVVCDEGHIIKNSKSAISMAVAKIVTPRRIVLTGTPIQNNLKEYYSMVNFIKPLFLGTEKEFANLYANPIKNGQHKDSGKTDIKIMKQRSFVLHKKLSKFVQRKEAELLKTFLPTKYEYVLFIPMTDVQNNLYQHILNAIANRDETYRGKGLITDYTCLRKIWTHPKVLEDAWKNAVNQRNKRENRKLMAHSDDDQPDDIYDSQTGQMSVTNDWWRHLVTDDDLESIMPSNKLRTMFKILQICEEKGEKCLIFSAFVAVLNVVEYFFKKLTDNDSAILNALNINGNSKWILGQDYYRLDGKTPKTMRHAMINEFNNVLNKRARIFLISAKAGGQGINLIGANRVIILDTSWNPSNDQQNIFRVFRLGQKRICYIYRLLAMGTMEEKVYSRSVTKQAMSFRVVDEQQIDRHYNMAELAELYTLTIPDHNNRPTPILPQDSILARLLRTFPDLVFQYHEHDSLLENKVEQELSEQEKNEAWTAYERDLQMSSEIREMPNMEDLQNKFNSNLTNYLSPFSGLDVSNSNNQNPSTSKNMSHLFNYRGFSQPFLQTLLGQTNNNAATTQQYIDMFNYYKNLGSSYADLNAYSTGLPGLGNAAPGGRMPTVSTPSNVPTNPLTALGDLSMYGLSSSALQNLGTSAAALNLPSSLSTSNALQQLTNPASMYTSSPSNTMQTNLPTTSASNMAAGGLTSSTNSAAMLSAFEQYTQSLRGSFPNMYNYTGDFGLSSSGSTILDKSKGKNSKQGNSNKNTNLPGGSKGAPSMGGGIYSAPPAYVPRPNSRNTPNSVTTEPQPHKGKSSNTSPTTSASPSSSNNSMMTSNSGRLNKDLINYRRMDSTGTGGGGPSNGNNTSNPLTQQKKNEADNSNNAGGAVSGATGGGGGGATTNKSNSVQNSKPTKTVPNITNSALMLQNQKSNQKSSLSLHSNASSSGSSKISQAESNRSMNMGISYPNSKGADKSSNNPNSPLNMGIVYPRSSNKSSSSSSEMQIIPTSSPPGTTSISKQLNELSPSISLTAVKNTNTSNKTMQQQTPKTNSPTTNPANNQNMQINKVMQNNNTTVRRTTSPVQNTATTAAGGGAKISGNGTGGNSTSSQNSILARYKTMSNNNTKKTNNNNPVPPLHRGATIASIAQATAGSTKTGTTGGLTITNVKTPIKPQNVTAKQVSSAQQQASTLAKQTAAAAVAKSSVQRLSTPNTPNSSPNTLQKSSSTPNTTPLPSLTSIKRVIKRASPNVNPNKISALTPSSSSSSLTVTPSNKVPIISSVKSISQSPSTMATISKASVAAKPNAMILSKSTTSSASNPNLTSVSNVSKALAQMQKRLPATAASSTSANSGNATRSTVNIRPVDNKQNPAGTGGVYIIETNINDKKLAIGTPTKSGGGTTVTKVPIQTAIKRKATDTGSKDISIESKRLKN